jgi:dUTP pyrophosphatase
MQARFKRLDPRIEAPRQAHPGDAAVDLQCRIGFALEPGQRLAVPTGLAVAIPEGYAGFILPRSGHARRHGLGAVNSPGLIDSGYRGEIHVLLVNHGSEKVSFEVGDRIAQLMLVEAPWVEWVEALELDDTDRGDGGFGSSGM